MSIFYVEPVSRLRKRLDRLTITLSILASPLILLMGGLDNLSIAGSVFCLSFGLTQRFTAAAAQGVGWVFSILSFLYLVIPVSFISILGTGYEFGRGISAPPYSRQIYQDYYPQALLVLFLLIVSISAGLHFAQLLFKSNHRTIQFPSWLLRVKHSHLLTLALIVFAQTASDNISYLIGEGEGGGGESLLKFLLFDHPFIVLAGAVVAISLASASANDRYKVRLFTIVAGLFFLASLLAGSKGGILVLLTFMIILPNAAMNVGSLRNRYVWIRPRYLIIGAALSVAFFYLMLMVRVAVKIEAFKGVSGFDASSADAEIFASLGGDILYRISAGLDRYILIFTSIAKGDLVYGFSTPYFEYIGKNFLNLILPGTPYAEAYAPSSNLLNQVLTGRNLDAYYDSAAQLMARANTQPYTGFGVALLLLGPLAPLGLFLFGICFGISYFFFRYWLLRLTLLYLFAGLFASYGAEVVLANSMHFFVSAAFMSMLLYVFRKKGKGILKSASPISIRHAESLA